MEPQPIYNSIGRGYNTTRRADPYIAERLLSLLAPPPEGICLDIGCGTGSYTIKLAQSGVRMIGVDPSAVMLHEAQQRDSSVQWILGQAEAIPLPDNTVDCAIATLTVHHWKNHKAAFAELARVLKPGARLVIFTFTPEQERGYWFNHFFPEMMKRGMLKSLPLSTLADHAKAAGLKMIETEKYFVHDGLQDLFGYSGKKDPERYFDPAVLNGISYFSIYADKSELESGLRSLRTSIDDGTFPAIKQKFENDEGDYLFVVFEK
jgi:ubiquinone/menaquinone biosynthesis C-methylase UbiE